MARRIGILLMALIAMVSFLYTARAQMGGKTWEKTVTLPSGEVILDMSGEWQATYEYYGFASGLGSGSGVPITITQEGNTFIAVITIESRWLPKDAESFKGVLNGDGFEAVQIYRPDVGWTPCMWEISENGNKIVFEDGRCVNATLTRR
jgi:hypothetical protein